MFEGSTTNGMFSTIGTGTAIQFNRRIRLAAKVNVMSATDSGNYVQRLTFGKRGSGASGSDVGDLAVRGFGVKSTGASNAIVLTVHNGTTLTDVTSTFTPTAGGTFDILIDSDGSGNVTLYVNGTQHATTTAGPTGASTGIVPTVWVETVATAAVAAGSNSAFHATNITLDLGTA